MKASIGLIRSLVAATALITATAAPAVTIDFEPLAQTGTGFVLPGNVYNEDGFTVTNINGFGLAVPRSGQTNWYTGSAAMFTNGSNNTTTLTRTGGGAFDLVSIDLSEIDVGRLGPTPVIFTGLLAAGGTVTQSITLDGVFGLETLVFSGFDNVTQVSWKQLSEYHQFDNIVVQPVDVPEPASGGLLLSGLLPLFRRRRKQQALASLAVQPETELAPAGKRLAGWTVAALLALLPAVTMASPVTMTATSNNVLEVHFTAPVQPGAHNAIQFSSSLLTGGGSITGQASLYDEAGLLGSRSITGFLGGRFTSPTSFFSGGSIATNIDWSRIADGVTDGTFIFQITSSTAGAFYSFDTSNIFGMTFGDGGGFPAYYPVISSVSVYTAPVDEPAALLMLALGLGGLAGARLRRARTGTA